MPCGKRHWFSIGQIPIAQNPAGTGRPGQHSERGRHWNGNEITCVLHFRNAKAPAWAEHRKNCGVRGVLREQSSGDAATVAHRLFGLACHDGLATQNAVLVGVGQADDLQTVFLDQPDDPFRFGKVLV